MNGATAEPWLKTIKTPNNAKTIIIGSNQYFFQSLKIPKILLKNLSLKLFIHSTDIFISFFPITIMFI